MAPVTNGRLLFNEVPAGYPEPGKTTVYDESETIDPDTVALNGGYLIKTLLLSIDPYLRGRMRDPSVKAYSPPFVKGEPIANFGLGVVLRSEHADVKVGDHVYGFFPFVEYFAAPNLEGYRVLKNPEGLPWSVYVGIGGLAGQTAYFGWKEYADTKKGDVVFVTAGSGPVGSFVVQLAKADGLKVIASAGSDEKVAFVKSIGADVAFNYKTTKTADVLAKEGPIDIYWDNVGGESFDAALGQAAHGARFIECGMISAYNGQAPPVKNLLSIVAEELKIYGFIVSTLAPKYGEAFYAEIPPRIKNGEFKYIEDVKKGLRYAGDAIYEVQKGLNHGKSLVVVAEE